MDATGEGKTYTRMTGFTSMSESKNASEYSRHYVDEESERTDVVGYATSNDYEFDRYTNDPVQQKIAEISDDKSQKFQRREPNKPQIDVTKRKK